MDITVLFEALSEAWPFLGALVIAGLLAGFAGGLFGIGGGVILVPVLYALLGFAEVSEDIRLPMAIGTSLAVIIVTAASSLNAHRRSGEVDGPLLRAWLPWIGLGAVGSGFVAEILPKQLLALIFASGAIYIGVSRLTKREKDQAPNKLIAEPREGHEALKENSPQEESKQANSHWAERMSWALGLATGFFSSLMGLGGGAAGVLVMGWTGHSMHRAVATASGFGLGVAIPGAAGFIVAGWHSSQLPPGSLGFVSFPAFVILGLMTSLTAPLGARTAHIISGRSLSRGFGLYILIVAIFMIREALI